MVRLGEGQRRRATRDILIEETMNGGREKSGSKETPRNPQA